MMMMMMTMTMMMTAINGVPLHCGGGGEPMMEGEILARELETCLKELFCIPRATAKGRLINI